MSSLHLSARVRLFVCLSELSIICLCVFTCALARICALIVFIVFILVLLIFATYFFYLQLFNRGHNSLASAAYGML